MCGNGTLSDDRFSFCRSQDTRQKEASSIYIMEKSADHIDPGLWVGCVNAYDFGLFPMGKGDYISSLKEVKSLSSWVDRWGNTWQTDLWVHKNNSLFFPCTEVDYIPIFLATRYGQATEL